MFYNQILDPFLLSVRNFSSRNAFCIGEEYYTYKLISEYVSKIRLAVKNADSANVRVGLVVNDDIETYASIFALWLEGKC